MNHEMIETFNLMFNSCNPLIGHFDPGKNFQLFNNSCEKTSYKWIILKICLEEYIFLKSPSFKEHFDVFFSLSKIKL